MFVVELDLGHLEEAAPLGLIPQTILKRAARVLLSDEGGRAARLAYYEARKLNNPPNSLYDYHDAKGGLEPPAERNARERRNNRPPR